MIFISPARVLWWSDSMKIIEIICTWYFTQRGHIELLPMILYFHLASVIDLERIPYKKSTYKHTTGGTHVAQGGDKCTTLMIQTETRRPSDLFHRLRPASVIQRHLHDCIPLVTISSQAMNGAVCNWWRSEFKNSEDQLLMTQVTRLQPFICAFFKNRFPHSRLSESLGVHRISVIVRILSFEEWWTKDSRSLAQVIPLLTAPAFIFIKSTRIQTPLLNTDSWIFLIVWITVRSRDIGQ